MTLTQASLYLERFRSPSFDCTVSYSLEAITPQLVFFFLSRYKVAKHKDGFGPKYKSVFFLHLIKIGITSNLYSVIFVSRKPLQGDSSLPTSKASGAFSPLEHPPQATLAYPLNSSLRGCSGLS